MFPSGWVNFKLYEIGKHYTEIGFGAITWHGLTINSARWSKLPKEVQDIILEVAKEYEAKTGTVNEENYPKQLADLKSKGANVRQLPDKVRQDWANSLAAWPAQKAKELDGQGLPGSQVLEIALKAAEDAGHKWPVRYGLKLSIGEGRTRHGRDRVVRPGRRGCSIDWAAGSSTRFSRWRH
jgi:hypothetical protein